MKYCRSSAHAPATAGVEWLVPEEVVKNCWPRGKKLFGLPRVPPPGRAQTPTPLKHARAAPVVPGEGGGLSCPTPPVTCVPGPTISGFFRPSLHGPRLEKPTMSFALLASVSSSPQPSLPVALLPPLAVECEWTFSAAPTVKTFLAVPGDPTDPAPDPALPA